jgi:hypothetical protein
VGRVNIGSRGALDVIGQLTLIETRSGVIWLSANKIGVMGKLVIMVPKAGLSDNELAVESNDGCG